MVSKESSAEYQFHNSTVKWAIEDGNWTLYIDIPALEKNLEHTQR